MIYQELKIEPPCWVYTKGLEHKCKSKEHLDEIIATHGYARVSPHAHSKEAEETFDVMLQYPLPEEKKKGKK